MKGYFNNLLVYIFAGVMLTFMMWVVNSGILVTANGSSSSSIKLLDVAKNPINDSSPVYEQLRKALVISDDANDTSQKLTKNMLKTLDWMKFSTDNVDVKRKDAVSYMDYDVVIVAMSDIDNGFGTDIERLMDYVDKGGRLFWAIEPESTGGIFRSVYRKLGIASIGSFSHISGFNFEDELIAGSKGLSFEGDEFIDISIEVALENTCRVYVSDTENKNPIVLNYHYGDGEVTFYNATSSAGDYFTGMLSGCILSLFDEYAYPVINAKVVFIDDFPSPQYNSDSDIIKEEYNRTVREFYRDIWWPDMQSAAKKHNLSYTGLFMATYNDIVNPDEFVFEKDDMELYFGNSLLKNDFEIGAHGYNHQSLTLSGGTPEYLGYKPWNSEHDMFEAIRYMNNIAVSMFSGIKLKSYVPPSNYLSKEGRQAVADALPYLKIISGVYTNEGSEGDVYVQNFEIAEDGIAEFPRFTSGMLESDYEDFVTINGCGLYGVFSHFIHPDDILDPERSGGLTWQKLTDNFAKRLNLVNTRYEGLQPLTAANAADALKIADSATVLLRVSYDNMFGICYNYYGETTLLLKSDRKPLSSSSGCTITPITQLYDTDYYYVKIEEPTFLIRLGD